MYEPRRFMDYIHRSSAVTHTFRQGVRISFGMIRKYVLIVFCTGMYAGDVSGTAAVSQQEQTITEADAFIRSTFAALDLDQYEAAVSAYLSILARVGADLSPEENLIVERHLRSIALVMEEVDLKRIGLDLASPAGEMQVNLKPGASDLLIRWWALQDNMPASPSNDRLIEHLYRITSAWQNYGHQKDPRGFDDRGAIFVRLGEPSRKAVVRITTTDLQFNTIGVRIPDNEFWVYQHVGYDAHYLFAQKRKRLGYKLSQPLDLIPRQLQNSRRHSRQLLLWMEEVYGQLALLHNSFGQRYDEVAGFVTLPSANSFNPDLFARNILNNTDAEDRQMEWQREQNVPVAFSNTRGLALALDVPFRWARFLEPDGSTRTEVYWTVNASAMKPSRRFVRRMYKEGHEPSEDYLISMYASQRDIDLKRVVRAEKHYLTKADATRQLPVKTMVLQGEQATYNLALQWEQRWTIPGDGTQKQPGARLKMTTQVLDSIAVLHGEGRSLEMSDIKALRYEPGTFPGAGEPYPHAQLEEDVEIALYVEIYNLTFGPEDQTQYTIFYEVAPYGEKRGEPLRSGTSYSGTERDAREILVPDLSSENIGKGVEITLFVTDTHSGEEKQRTITFMPR